MMTLDSVLLFWATLDCCLETCISCACLQILLYCLLFFHMYALRMSVINKEATYSLTYML